MIGNLQYIVICRLIAHLEQSKAVEISDKQIVWLGRGIVGTRDVLLPCGGRDSSKRMG